MQVEPLHQDPVVVGGQKVDEEQHGHFTADLKTKTFTRLLKAVCLCVCVVQLLVWTQCWEVVTVVRVKNNHLYILEWNVLLNLSSSHYPLTRHPWTSPTSTPPWLKPFLFPAVCAEPHLKRVDLWYMIRLLHPLHFHFTSLLARILLIFQCFFFTVYYCHCHLFRAPVPFIMSLSLLKTRLYLRANCVLSSPPFFKGLHQELMLLPWKQQLTEIINRMAVRPQNVGWTHKPPPSPQAPETDTWLA